MKRTDLNSKKLARTAARAYRLMVTSLALMILLALCAAPAFASGGTGVDPMAAINKLTDFVMNCISAFGGLVLLFGIVQLAMSIQSHDASQRTQGILSLVGGLLIAVAPQIVSLIISG